MWNDGLAGLVRQGAVAHWRNWFGQATSGGKPPAGDRDGGAIGLKARIGPPPAGRRPSSVSNRGTCFDANVVISEFMAINSSGLGGTTDSFGNKSDWIEIHNNGVAPVSLAGWQLTDGSNTWTFPSEPTWINSVLAANSYLVVYASGEDTVTLGGTQLHTNFKLSGDGEYLALLRPDGSVANEYAPQYPAQLSDVSYGITEATTTTTLLTQGAAGRILVPTSATQLPADWNSDSFDDTSAPWTGGTTGVGFQTVTSPGTLNETEPNNTTSTANSAVNNFASVAVDSISIDVFRNRRHDARLVQNRRDAGRRRDYRHRLGHKQYPRRHRAGR